MQWKRLLCLFVGLSILCEYEVWSKSIEFGNVFVSGMHVCMWLVIEIKWNLIDWYIFIYESIWLWGVLLFLIYSVWTKFVLIDKKGKSSYSTLKENDNGNFLGGNGVVSDRGQLHIMTGSQEVFGKHLLGQKCFSIWGWGVWLSFYFLVFSFYCEFHRNLT